ncbi:MAG TPA: NUDIX hydrolase [Candidatus Saccharimonadales bacterium]
MGQVDESKSVDFYNNLPGIRTGGGVLIFNTSEELLLVKPNYRNTWAWPGGGWEEGETPLATAIRECEEEIGVRLTHLTPAFVNYIPPRPDGSKDVLHFVFAADPVADDFLNQVTAQADEIEAVKFVPISELGNYMKQYRVVAVNTYLKHKESGSLLYLEDGRLI